MKNKISVITPVFNRSDCILKCLDSVAKQIIPENWELEHIVVDDGSFDNTKFLIEEYADSHPYVRTYHFENNRGPNAARNHAISNAHGDWIMFIDSDDELVPNAIETIISRIKGNVQITHFLFEVNRSLSKREHLKQGHILHFEDFFYEKITGDFVHFFLRKHALDEPFLNDLRIHEGITFLNYYKTAKDIMYFKDVIAIIDRNRNDCVTKELNLTSDTALINKIKAIDYKLEKFHEDYLKNEEGRKILIGTLQSQFKLKVLQGNQKEARDIETKLKELTLTKDILFTTINKLNLGKEIWFFAKILIKIKHRLKTIITKY